MLDTIKIFAPVTLSESMVLSTFLDVREHVSRNTGESFLTGKLRGLRAEIHPSFVLAEGSLAKFGQGHNLFGLGFHGDVRAIENLCELVRAMPEETQVRRVDLGTSLVLDAPPCDYIALLGERALFTRSCRSHSVTYSQAQHQYKAYDKIRQIRKEAVSGKISLDTLPAGWQSMTALRLESSLFKNIKGQLKLRKGDGRALSLADLCNSEVYNKLIRLWETDYFKLQKRSVVTRKGKPALTGTKGLNQFLQWRGLLAEGEEKLLAEILAAPDKKARQRMRAKIRALASLQPYTRESPLIQELDEKIREAARVALESYH